MALGPGSATMALGPGSAAMALEGGAAAMASCTSAGSACGHRGHGARNKARKNEREQYRPEDSLLHGSGIGRTRTPDNYQLHSGRTW